MRASLSFDLFIACVAVLLDIVIDLTIAVHNMFLEAQLAGQEK